MSAPRHRFLSVLFLVALWFTATQHCALEAAGIFAEQSHGATGTGHGCCATGSDGCESDACKAIEDGQYRSESDVVKAAAPDVATCFSAFCLDYLPPAADSDPGPLTETRSQIAPAWVPSWAFERRSAAPAHAPDSLIA